MRKAARCVARSNAKREGGKNDKQTKSLFKKPGNEDGTNHADWQGNHHTGTTESVEQALEARELIKINVLKNCVAMPGDVAALLAERTHSDVVQVIGRKIVLYRESKTKKKIELPKAKNTKE